VDWRRKYESQKLIDELRKTAWHQYVAGFFFAEAYVGVGQKDQALTWLERSYEDHDQWMVFVAAYPGFDRLRSELCFQATQTILIVSESILRSRVMATDRA